MLHIRLVNQTWTINSWTINVSITNLCASQQISRSNSLADQIDNFDSDKVTNAVCKYLPSQPSFKLHIGALICLQNSFRMPDGAQSIIYSQISQSLISF